MPFKQKQRVSLITGTQKRDSRKVNFYPSVSGVKEIRFYLKKGNKSICLVHLTLQNGKEPSKKLKNLITLYENKGFAVYDTCSKKANSRKIRYYTKKGVLLLDLSTSE